MARVRFEFKRPVAYQVALRFFGWAVGLANGMPKRMEYFGSQFVRAALSIPLNIAEAAGVWTRGNKRRYCAYARGSTFETAALLDALLATGVITQEEFDEREERLAEIGARLTRLCQRYDAGAHGAEPRRAKREVAGWNRGRARGVGRPKGESPPGKGG